MSYSDILRVKNLRNFRKLLTNPLYSRIPPIPIVVTNGLVMYLNGKDFTNSPPTVTWIDESGLGNNATPSGFAYTTASGSDGQGGVAFDGVDDKIIVNNSTVGDSDNFTIETNFIRPKVAQGTLISKAIDLASGARFIIDTNVARTNVRFFGYNTLNAVVGDTSAGVPVSSNTLTHGVFTFDGINFKIYINGVLKSTTAITGTLKPIANNFNIGNRGGGEIFDNIIKFVRVYNRVLADTEIVQNYNASILPIIVTNGLVMNLNGKDFINSPPTTTLIDESGLGNNATPSGFGYTATSGSDGLGGIVFDGIADKLLTNFKIDLTTQFSISVKFKFVAVSASKQTLWSYNDSDILVPNYNGIALTIPANLTTLTFENFNGTTSVFITSNLVVGTTYIIDLVKRVNGNYYLYMNNVLAGSQVALSTTMDPGATFGIGYYPYTTGTDFLNETLYSVLNYNRELTDAEITQNYNASK